MALPTFFTIGAAKAGTTSLHFYLEQHPEIQMSANKEPRFFAGPECGIPFAPGRVSRLQDYELLFDPTVAVRGESSTDYAFHPRRQGVPERIKQLIPQAKFIYLVRDPLARTISHFQMRVALLGERRSLDQAIADLSDPACPYIWPSLYASQLELYLRHFPQESVLVVDQSDLLSDRTGTLREIFSFLEVEPTYESPHFEQVLSDHNEWRAYPSGYVQFVERFIAPVVRWVTPELRRKTRMLLERALWRPLSGPELSEELSSKLAELYAPEAERLRALTGKRFSGWSL